MANHGVLIPNQIAAMNVDAFNRSVIASADIDNGNVLVLSAKSTTDGEGEVWTAIVPSTSNGLTGLWMAYSGDEIVVTDARYKGLDPDPRHFFNATGKVFSAYKPQLGDIITVTDEALAGTFISGTTTHVNATNSTGGYKLVWGNSQTSSVLSYKLLKVNYISLATGAIDSQRVTSYQFECVGL